jgi:hypothetical protein
MNTPPHSLLRSAALAAIILIPTGAAAASNAGNGHGQKSPSNTSPPSIAGTAQVGQTLSGDAGSWSGGGIKYSFQWVRCDSSGAACTSLSGATGSSYAPVTDDVGSTIRIVVTAANQGGTSVATSAPTAAVSGASAPPPPLPPTPPTDSSPPTVTGTAVQGQTLTATPGTWSGTQPMSYNYGWQRCTAAGACSAIAGATASTYTAASGDVSYALKVAVTAGNTAGSATAASAATATVATGTQTPGSTVCSLSTIANCPSSYFTGPLGNNNLLPSKPGAFLIDQYGGIGTTWAQYQAGVLKREQDMGRKFDGLQVHYDGSGTYGGTFGLNDPTVLHSEQWIHDNGSFPIASWTPNYTITQMNNGAADAVWTKAANYFKTYPFTIMLRTFTEFDLAGQVYAAVPDSANGNVNSCGTPFISAWKRMVNIFRQNGATNVGFWWNPEEGVTRSCVNVSYPGDAYVDWVGSDWYNTCLVGSGWCTPYHAGWAQFWELFNYEGFSFGNQHDLWGPSKPVVIGETGSWYESNYPSYKGDWFRNIPAAAKNMQYLRGISFYDEDVTAAEGSLANYRVDFPTTNPDVYAGFKQMAADPWFNAR